MKPCRLKDRLVNGIVKSTNNFQKTPYGVLIPAKNRDLKTSYSIAKGHVDRLNKNYDPKLWGRVASIREFSDSTGININVSDKLQAATDYKEGKLRWKEFNETFNQGIEKVEDVNQTVLTNQQEGNFELIDGEIMPPSELYYNLNNPDPKRKIQNNKLNALMSDALSKITVDGKPITVMSMEEYSNTFDTADNRSTTIGIANILAGVIGYVKTGELTDGITYSEEVLHFLIEALWDKQEIQDLVTSPEFITSKLYRDNYRKYLEVYNGNELKATKEIAAKLIANYMYDYRAAKFLNKDWFKKLGNKLYNLLASVTGLFKKIEYNVLPIEDYSLNLAKFLNKIDNGLSNETLLKEKVNIDTKDIKDLETSKSAIATNLKLLKQTVEQALKERSNIYRKLDSRQEELDIVLESAKELGITSKENTNVFAVKREYAVEKLDKLEAKEHKSTQDKEAINKIKDLLKLLDKIESDKIHYSNLNSLNMRVIKITEAIAKKQFAQGMFAFMLGNLKADALENLDINEYGLVHDLYNNVNFIKEKLKNPELIRLEDIHFIQHSLDLYKNPLKILEEYLKNTPELLPENTPNALELNKVLRDALERSLEYYNIMKRFVPTGDTEMNVSDDFGELIGNSDIAYHARKNFVADMEDPNDTNRDISKLVGKQNAHMFVNLSSYRTFVGRYQESVSDYIKYFQKIIKTTEVEVASKSAEKINKLYKELKELGYDKLGMYKAARVFYEYLDGKPTGYYNSDYSMHSWNKSKKEFQKDMHNQIKSAIQILIEKNGKLGAKNVSTEVLEEIKNMYIPENYGDIVKMFAPIYGLQKNKDGKLPELDTDLQAIWKIRDMYSKAWGNWEGNNSKNLSETEIKLIKANRKKQLSAYDYKIWEEANIRTYTNSTGEVVTYYTGELSQPDSEKHPNPEYSKLTSNERKMLELVKENHKNNLIQLNTNNFSTEFFNRAPQITTEAREYFAKPNARTLPKNIWNSFVSNFKAPEDDAVVAIREEETGRIIKAPPIRYTKVLSDPSTLSVDLMKNISMFTTMVENRNAMLDKSVLLESMMLSVANGQVTQLDKFGSPISGKTIKGESSNLYKAMNDLMESEVYGEKQLDGALNQVLKSVGNVVTNTALKYNLASIVTSYVSSELNLYANAFSGNLVTMKDYNYGKKEYLRYMAEGIKDWNLPIKRTKLSAIAQLLGVKDSISEAYTNQNVGVIRKTAFSLFGGYQGWGNAELMTSIPIISMVANQFKLIDGEWLYRDYYTGDSKLWDAAPNILSESTLTNGVVTFNAPDKLTSDYLAKTREVMNLISERSDSSDKSTLQRSGLGSLLTRFMQFFINHLDRIGKPKSYNQLTKEESVGYMRWSSLKVSAGLLSTNVIGILKLANNVVNITRGRDITSYEEAFRDKRRFVNDPTKQAELKNTGYIVATSLIVTAMSAIGYLLSVAGLDDDEDDDRVKSTILQFASLVVNKVHIELGSKISVSDLYEYASNPIANADRGLGILGWIDEYVKTSYNKHLESLEGTSSTKTTETAAEKLKAERDAVFTKKYQGLEPWAVSLVKYTPGLKGIYNNTLGWQINSALTGIDADQAVMFYETNNIIARKFSEKELKAPVTRSILGLPTGVFSRLTGYTIGKEIAKAAGYHNYDNSFPYINLAYPSKSANKVAK